MEMVCPIRSVTIPGLPQPVELKGLIVVVGPNSSGKTQLLHDINEVVLGRKRQLVVVSSVQFNESPNLPEYLALLIKNGVLLEGDNDQYAKRSFQFGTELGGGDFPKSHALHFHNEYKSAAGKSLSNVIPQHKFLEIFGPFSCSALFLKNRLTLMDCCPNFDPKSAAPRTTLQALHWNSSAEKRLRSEIASTFKRGLWIDAMGRHGYLVVRVADNPSIPSAEDRLKPDKMDGYRGIETEGDGIRSYSAICAALLLERRPLCIIDEPEMCLHPPQAHAMGRFIGEHVSDGTATVVATHSSYILRGILESNPKAHVIRLSRIGSNFMARLLTPDTLAEATSKPRSRSEAIFEGLFAQAIVLCEAEGDRIVYESTYRTLRDQKLDIRFVPSEGTGGFADPLRLYTALGVPSAVMADLDFLGKDAELKNVLTAFGTDRADINTISEAARSAMHHVRAAACCHDVTAVQGELKSLSELTIDPAKGGVDVLRGRLKKLVDQMYRLEQLKEVGIDSIPVEWSADTNAKAKIPLRENIKSVVAKLKSHGLFLVPVGELESWLPIKMKGISREDKSKWAMNAAEKIEDAGEQEEDVWLFVRSVTQFLSDHYGLESIDQVTPAEIVSTTIV